MPGVEHAREAKFMDWTEIGKWVLAAIAAIGAIGLVVKFSISRKSSTSTTARTVTQNNNRAGGDIVGGNKVDNSTR
jgi:hypothetical protein